MTFLKVRQDLGVMMTRAVDAYRHVPEELRHGHCIAGVWTTPSGDFRAYIASIDGSQYEVAFVPTPGALLGRLIGLREIQSVCEPF